MYTIFDILFVKKNAVRIVAFDSCVLGEVSITSYFIFCPKGRIMLSQRTFYFFFSAAGRDLFIIF